MIRRRQRRVSDEDYYNHSSFLLSVQRRKKVCKSYQGTELLKLEGANSKRDVT